MNFKILKPFKHNKVYLVLNKDTNEKNVLKIGNTYSKINHEYYIHQKLNNINLSCVPKLKSSLFTIDCDILNVNDMDTKGYLYEYFNEDRYIKMSKMNIQVLKDIKHEIFEE